jgi:hypothetical protein
VRESEAHTYIWDTLRAMGIAEEFITLIRGLVEAGTAKVHFNGLFTARFPLQRGVRQGCPLAPLLYALATQPFMEIMKEQLVSQAVQGIPLSNGKQLLYQLFADDTGLFFEASESNFAAILDCIKVYERIFGAKLIQLDLIQLDQGDQPAWFPSLGCKIAAPKEQHIYLGCPFGRDFSSHQELEYVLGKIRNKLRHWSNRLLSMTSKMVLLKHVLREYASLLLDDFRSDTRSFPKTGGHLPCLLVGF